MMPYHRMMRSSLLPRKKIKSAEDAYHHLRPHAYRLDREYFWRIDLDSRDGYLGHEVVSIGTLDASLVVGREVFTGACRAHAHHIIVAHNHPSQDPAPSKSDRELTGLLSLAGVIMGVELRDHLILTDDGYFSFKKARLL